MSFDWASLAGAAIEAVGSYFGSENAQDANDEGTRLQIAAQQKALADAKAEREKSKAAALTYLQPDLDQSGADAVMRAMMTARPEELTPSQKIGLEDLTRTGRNNLAAGGLRGAGRAGQAVLDDSTRRFMADATDTNQRRSDAAAQTLSQRGAATRASAANVETGIGSANAGDILDVGSQIGTEQGNNVTANGQISGQTLGAIAGMLGNTIKRGVNYPSDMYYVN